MSKSFEQRLSDACGTLIPPELLLEQLIARDLAIIDLRPLRECVERSKPPRG